MRLRGVSWSQAGYDPLWLISSLTRTLEQSQGLAQCHQSRSDSRVLQ